MSSPSRLSRIQAAILSYLQRHPNAADTVEGIACWWLPDDLGGDREKLAQALEGLVQAGQAQRRINRDKRIIYSSARQPIPH